MTQKYLSSSHNKHLLLCHLIFVVKYRKPLLIRYGSDVKLKILEIESKSNFVIDTLEVDRDHIHLLVRYTPSVSIP